MSFHLYFLLLLFRSGAPPMILLTAEALADPQLHTTDARLIGGGRVPPTTKILATPVTTITIAAAATATATENRRYFVQYRKSNFL